jgi:hypothetical protein
MSAPALFTQASMRPSVFCAASPSARTDASSAMFVWMTAARRPAAWTCRSTSRAPGSLSRYVSATSAPAWAAAIAIARPIPLDAPVTRTLRPASGAAGASFRAIRGQTWGQTWGQTEDQTKGP